MAMVTRLVGHKGVDLVQAIAEGLLQQGIELVILGSGESQYENFFNELCARNPGRVGVYIGFNAKLAQEIYAGADIFLMPSRSEPCGLAQMVSCRYGTIPVIRETGGLKDSIRDSGDGYGNGFTFANYNAHELYEACCAPRKAIGRRMAGLCWSSAPWSVISAGPTPPRATRACITRSSTSGNLFIKCGLSSKAGTAFFVEKQHFSQKSLDISSASRYNNNTSSGHGPRRKEYAEVAELADALDSGSSSLKRVWVQIPSSAP